MKSFINIITKEVIGLESIRLYEVLKRKQLDHKMSYRYVIRWLDNHVPYQMNQSTRQTVHIEPNQSKRKFAVIQIELLDYSQNVAPNR